MKCPECKAEDMIPTQEANSVSVAGIFAALVVIFLGLPALVYNALLGVVIIGLAFLASAIGRGKHTVMVCPACKNRIKL